MFSKFKLSLRNINYKLFFALLTLGFVQRFTTPSAYFFSDNCRANGRIPLQGNSHG